MQGTAIEPFWGKQVWGVVDESPTDPELFDQGKQTKFVHVREWHRPRKFLVSEELAIIEWSEKGVMELGNGSDVPGVAGQGTRAETWDVVDEWGDDHFDDLQG